MRGATATLGATPASLMNEVRDCSSAPHVTGTPSFQELLDERSREFILEPWRRNDLIRFGQFEADWGEKNRYKVWDNAEHTEFHWVERQGAKDPNRRGGCCTKCCRGTAHNALCFGEKDIGIAEDGTVVCLLTAPKREVFETWRIFTETCAFLNV